jgi:hypothetical protein
MLLEANGYKTKMFEFVAPEHTPKNNMLVAVKVEHRRDPAAIKANIRQVKEQFGIASHRLDDLLAASALAVQS